ncbi:MAG: chorismate mutase, partial [Clostridia bacterium]|nr:chorismate mutase [Clostridia bacterium]
MEIKDLNQCRKEIDRVDDQIAELFRERMEIALDVAKYKKEHGLPVTNRAREREILARVTEKTGDELAGYAKVLYNSLFDLSRSYQVRYLTDGTPLTERIKNAIEETPRLFPEKAVVACQGVEGAY